MKEESFAKWCGTQQIMIVGVGGFGCKVAARMHENKYVDVATLACDTDLQDLESVEVPNRLLLEKKCANLVWRIIDKSIDFMTTISDNTDEPSRPTFNVEPIRKMFTPAITNVIVVAGMGGVCGTNAAAQIAREAQAAGKRTAAVVALPFRFEGSKRMRQALNGLSKLAPHVCELHVLNTHDLIDGNVPAGKAFSLAEALMCEAVVTMDTYTWIPSVEH